MQSQMRIDAVRQRGNKSVGIAAVVSVPLPITSPHEGVITYIGTPFPHWPEVKHALASRQLVVRETLNETNIDELLSVHELAQTDLVVVGDGHVDSAREAHEICGDLRRRHYPGPILLMTSANDPISRILGLESGADAWGSPDVDARSVVAQMRALLRRQKLALTVSLDRDACTLRAGNFAMDSRSREVAVDGVCLELSRLEFELLWNLLKQADQIISRERLTELIGYGTGRIEGRAIDTLVGRLRHRLGRLHAKQIRTMRGVGYMLRASSMLDTITQARDANVVNN